MPRGDNMRKIKLLLFAFIVSIFTCINVYAQLHVLAAVGSSIASSNYEHYSYSNTQIYRQGNEMFITSTVKNNKKKNSSICIEVLLFDENKNNIGVFNYNSAKDYETQFADYKIPSGGTVTFNHKIIDKYLANKEKNTLDDIAYFSIINENEYCKIGGYDNYYKKSYDSIVSDIGVVHSGTKFDIIVSKINRYIPIDGLNVGVGIGAVIVIVALIIFLAIWIAFGAFLNKLHNAMYGKTTPLAYVPIANSYLCVKMAFGKIIALSYLGVSLLAGLLTFLGLGFLVTITSLAEIAAFILDIIKLATGKYDLAYLDHIKTNVVDNYNTNDNNNQSFMNNNMSTDVNNNQAFNNQNQPNEYGYSQEDKVKESLMGVSTDKALDEDNSNNNFEDKMNVNLGSSNTNNEQNNNNDSGESDLSKFFR